MTTHGLLVGAVGWLRPLRSSYPVLVLVLVVVVVFGDWWVVVSGAGGGCVPLSAAIGALRDELMHAIWVGQAQYQLNGQQRTLRFKPAPIEVTLQVAVTSAGKGHAGVKWWLIEAGGELSRQKVATQTVKLMLEPMMFDQQGQQVELLIDAADTEGDSATSSGDGEALLDASD